jgi:transcriptional regulator with GAF, ATPase, and Fis domain
MAIPASAMIDLTRDLSNALDLGTTTSQVNEILGRAVDSLGRLVPFDLATVMELRGDELHVRMARGSLASPAVEEHRLHLNRFPAIRALLGRDRARAFTEDDHGSGDGDAFDGVLDLPHGHSCMVVPLRDRNRGIGIMTFDRKTCGVYPEEVVELADVFGKLLAMVISYGEQSAMLSRMGDQLKEQNRLLSNRVRERRNAAAKIETTRDLATMRAVRHAKQVAVTDTPVLISGETGTGKEVMANAIHGWSHRAGRPLVSINCAALPPNLIESELFGHVKGAFSGATGSRMGRFQTANGGTLFLDEIGELPLELQPKFLRALQEGCFEQVGSDRTIKVDVRIIAATNADLVGLMADGRFREDLYYRLAVFPIQIPPLRERREDIVTIAESFLGSLSGRTGRGPWRLSQSSRKWLESREWPGNIRELVNTLERATIISPGATLEIREDHEAARPAPGDDRTEPGGDLPVMTLEEMERKQIEHALDRAGGRLYGTGGAAEMLGINPNTLRSRMKKLGLGGARSYRVKPSGS